MYLRGFTSDGGLHVHDIARDETRFQTPVNTAVEKGFYEATGPDGAPTEAVEDLFTLIETNAKPVLQKLDAGEEISWEERQHLAVLLAFFHVRGPAFRAWLRGTADSFHKEALRRILPTVDDVKQSVDEYEAHTGEDLDVPTDVLHRFIQEGRYDVTLSTNFTMTNILRSGLDVLPFILRGNWAVMHADDAHPFVTADAPLTLIPPLDFIETDPSQYGVGTPDVLKLIPLTSRAVLLIGDSGLSLEHQSIDEELREDTNMKIAVNARALVIGRTEAAVHAAVRAREDFFRRFGPRKELPDIPNSALPPLHDEAGPTGTSP